jgi:hypothetical protein
MCEYGAVEIAALEQILQVFLFETDISQCRMDNFGFVSAEHVMQFRSGAGKGTLQKRGMFQLELSR